MDLPRPGPAHKRLMRLEGRWSGFEQLSPSPFGPGGVAFGRSTCRSALDGMALVQDYEEEKDGRVAFRGHGVFTIEPGSDDVLWWWFDSMGLPPERARGHWDGDELLFEKSSTKGDVRYRYTFNDDGYRFVIENRFAGDAAFSEFMRGDYTRHDHT
ncbi:DUF1579 family protein [Montanilutibacter psychrotolerans]|uniref:DUF1579 domain-containing protein n=1 Tax=Montanilutibacter psychrotolerans TaxID=1327343 RepID=A0A3M8SV80_9GAMM|nr:DUF1579 family protein [Lysobacter psychrotolerans]RNF82612.1 DUF1579 domain-containing protein [Lysobacter psychrotolerans]